MKQTSILLLCISLLLLVSGQLARGQNSGNTVKFKVVYDASTDTYTTYLVPDYNVPNANNPLSVEEGSTAQFTLVVPRNFVISSITDINGNWDKTPQKLGPGQPNQDWSGYGLNPNLNYYAIGKSALETNYGVFQIGQPVPLFSFKGNGCFGPIQPLSPTDIFINAADNAYSLNVSNSFYSRSGQPSGGNQEPLEQFVALTGPPTTCLLASPDAATVVVGNTVTIPILVNDRNADGTSVVDLSKISPPAVSTPAKGLASVNPNGTVSYTATPGSSGTDTFSYTICDNTSQTVCSSTTVTITITPSVTASPDAGTVSAGTGGTAVANVRTNDVVNGVAATAANSALSVVGTYPTGITLNTSTGSVSVAVGTPPGTYPLVYQLCDLLTPATCATTTATITVTPSVTASPDAGTVSSGTGGTAVANVTTNDRVNGQPASLGTGGNATIASVGTYPPGITLSTTTGSVSVAIGTTPGSYTVAYQLCDKLTTPTCTTGLVAITVTPSVTASPDAGTVSSGIGGTAASVRTNDLVNGVAATAANSVLSVVGTYPPGITLSTSSGSVGVAVGTPPGTYTLVYQLCDLLTPATCATTTATITVTPSVTAAPDAGTVSSGTGGTAVANVTTNDRVNGQPATLGTGGNATIASVGTYPTGITLSTTTGSVSVAVGTVPGTYTLVYQLCDRLTTPTCTTTTATITVTPSVTASPDAGTVSSGMGGTAVANVRLNDVVNGVAATSANSALSVVGTYPAGITLNTSTGSVSVAVGTTPGIYTLVYQLCDLLTPATCTTTTATITVTPSVTASPDAGTVSAGMGGTAVANVRTNDIVNGVAATSTNSALSVVGTYPTGITLNTSTGSVSVAIGTVPGTYTLVYQLCDLLTPATCTTTTATITVTPSVTATPDAGTVSSGTGGTAANVRTNDVVNGVGATSANSVLSVVGTYPLGLTLSTSTGSVGVAQGTPPGTYTLVYQLCDLLTPATCTTTTATITVTPSVTASPDAGTVSSGTGGTAVASVRLNDVVNGVAATSANSALSVVGTYPSGITLNTGTGSVTVAVGTPPGTYTLVYQLCDLLTPATCTTTTATITVTPSVTASPDAGTVSSGTGGTAVANITTNDIVNGQPATLGTGGNATIASVGTYPTGITLSTTTGLVSVAIGTVPGSYTVAYQLCDRLTTPTCTTGLVSLTVTPSVVAIPDAGTVSSSIGGTAANVRLNDVVNGVAATAANSVLSVVGTYPPGLTLSTSSGSVGVAQGTPPGTYTLVYQLCDLLTPATCTTTTATITVTPSVTAAPDAGTVSSGTGGTAVANVTTNDVVNGQPATLGTGGNATIASVGTYPTGITLGTTTGSVSVAIGTVPGSYTLVYQLCDKLTTPTCTTGLVAITVTPSVTASPDAGTVSSGTGGTAVANVTTNDRVNGQPATLGTGGNATIASVGTYPTGITLGTTTGSVSVAVGTVPGSYTVAYQLCDKLTTPTCTTGLVAITVTPSVTASPDAGTVSTGTGGTAVANVTTNDIVNGQPATLGTGGNATIASVGTYPPGITLNATTGAVNVAPGTVPGSYTLVYQLCDKLTTPTCTTGLVAITVTPSVTASPDAGTVSSGTGGTAVANVAANDVVNGQPATLGTGGNATVTGVNTPPGITLSTTGSVSVAVGTTPGSYTLVYQLCDKLTTPTCTTGLAFITVTPSLTAVPDAGTVTAGAGGLPIPNVTMNDVVNGIPATLGAGGNATVAVVGTYPPGITLNPATGSVSVAVGTTPGTYTMVYQLCDKLSSPTCTTALVRVTVSSSLTAVADGATVVGGFSVTIPILGNDTNPDGSGIADLSQVNLPVLSGSGPGAPTKGVAVVNPDGSVSYTANIGSVGTDVFSYTICDRLNPGVCSTAQVSVSITANLSVVLAPKVYLQGALFGVPAGNPLMRDDLRAKGYVPLNSPYAMLNLIALTPVGPTTSSVLSVTGSQAVVDWVFVELRSPASTTTVVDSRPALLLRSGDIVEVDGVSSLSFSAAQTGSYFVGVRHRNHLSVLSAQAIPLSYSTTVVDFRLASTPTYNLNAANAINQAQVVVDQGVALWAGNALYDTNVIYQGPANDVNVISQQVINASGNIFVIPSYKLRGYYTGDVNLNGETIFQGTGNDVDFIYQNIIKNHPGNSLKQNFFKIREQLP